MIIRNIKQADNKALAGLIKAVFEEYHAPLVNTVYDDPRTLTMYEIFRTPRSEYFVVEDEGEVLGGCGYYPTEGLPAGYAELVKFYFSPKLRGKGMGKRLIRMVIQAAKTAGYENLYIESFPEFSFAVSMYEKNGFVHLPSRLGNSGHTATTIHMVKNLRGELQKRLFAMQDKEYALFQAKLTPGIPMERFIGVRVPLLRAFAKTYIKEEESKEFLNQLPHVFYDENMLHGLLISLEKDYDYCIEQTECFLPYIDNWAVCDIMSPKVFVKHKKGLLPKIKEWSKSSHTYTCRFGLEMLMSHFLDDDFHPEYLEIVAAARSDAHYVKMMVAWFFATALAKQWDATIPYLQDKRLATWTHNKTIQKACESYRITPEQKEYLKTLRVK